MSIQNQISCIISKSGDQTGNWCCYISYATHFISTSQTQTAILVMVLPRTPIMFTTMPPSGNIHCEEEVQQYYILSSRVPREYITTNYVPWIITLRIKFYKNFTSAVLPVTSVDTRLVLEVWQMSTISTVNLFIWKYIHLFMSLSNITLSAKQKRERVFHFHRAYLLWRYFRHNFKNLCWKQFQNAVLSC